MKTRSVLYIELVLCVILIFKINIKFFGPHKAYLGFIERIFTAWGCSILRASLKIECKDRERMENQVSWGTFT